MNQPTESIETSCAVLLDQPAALAERYQVVRMFTESLCSDLRPEDTVAQSMADASPVKWHLAHTSWFFETFILEKAFSDYRCLNPHYRVMFNSYYNTVGEQYLRPNRGLVTRPGFQEVMEYRRYVDESIMECLGSDKMSLDLQRVLEVGIQHEQQHQELILTDLKHLFSCNPLNPVYRQCRFVSEIQQAPIEWHLYTPDTQTLGYNGEGFAFDNETPAYQAFIQAFELASRPVTNGEYLEFIQDQGYHRAELWLSDGWALVQRERWQAPLYWRLLDGRWHTFTLSGLRPVREDEPLTHVSYYEADAYSRWRQARLPTEQEWEFAARQQTLNGNFVESGFLHPVPAEHSGALQKLFGDVWEWTQSPYTAYPGFKPAAGELAEYNGKFMCNQMVLRGGSCATPQSHIRATYRNFFYPGARWQFSGVRLARDADAL